MYLVKYGDKLRVIEFDGATRKVISLLGGTNDRHREM